MSVVPKFCSKLNGTAENTGFSFKKCSISIGYSERKQFGRTTKITVFVKINNGTTEKYRFFRLGLVTILAVRQVFRFFI